MAHSASETDTVTLVNQVINHFFDQSITRASLINPSYRQLWDNLHNLIQSGGKRLRPQMTILAYEAFGGTDISAVIPVAAAQELLHFCLLIHDDIIDRDYVRYGIPNVAGQYQTSYIPFVENQSERTHYANSAAILGGDLMLSGAYQLIASSELSDKDKLTAQAFLARSVFDVAAGELLDTESSFVPYTPGDALTTARYKTASYSFTTPLLTGAQLAAISPEQSEILSSYALALGVSYQLVDDLLGVFGDEQTTGKSTSGDIREGKRTYLVEQVLANLTPEEMKVFEATFGNPEASPEAITTMRELFISSGARQRTEQSVTQYAQQAREALALLDLDNTSRSKFKELIHKVTERSF